MCVSLGKQLGSRRSIMSLFKTDWLAHNKLHTFSTQLNPCSEEEGGCTDVHVYTITCVHVLMRDERRKEERSKQGQTNIQGKATQYTQGSHFS